MFSIQDLISIAIISTTFGGALVALVAHLYGSKAEVKDKEFNDFIGEITIEELNEGEKR